LRLVGKPEAPRRVFSQSGEDITEAVAAWSQQRVLQLEKEELRGFIFKKSSSSSGLERVKLYDHNGVPNGQGGRLFHPHLYGALSAPAGKGEWVAAEPEAAREFHHLGLYPAAAEAGPGRMQQTGRGRRISHPPQVPDSLPQRKALPRDGAPGRRGQKLPFETLLRQYSQLLHSALNLKTTVRKQVNVLQHILDYLKRELSADEKQEALALIEDYRNELMPLFVPITLLNHFVRKYDQLYTIGASLPEPTPA